LQEKQRKLAEGYDWRKIEKCNGNPMESDVSECQVQKEDMSQLDRKVEEVENIRENARRRRIKKAQHQNEERKKSVEKPDSEELCNGLGLS
jgi:hypothetical protein